MRGDRRKTRCKRIQSQMTACTQESRTGARTCLERDQALRNSDVEERMESGCSYMGYMNNMGLGQGGTHKRLASTNATLQFVRAFLTLEQDDDFLRCFSLLMEDGLRLSSKALLLPVVSPLSLCHERILPLLVLRYRVSHVFVALRAVCPR
jgi:hypothetical protein